MKIKLWAFKFLIYYMIGKPIKENLTFFFKLCVLRKTFVTLKPS